MAGKTRPPPQLRILCFGNSLSCGYPHDHPYATRLREVLEWEFRGKRVECVVNGQPGDMVTGRGYADRLQRAWTTAPKPYDWTIILGGTNDLGWGRPAAQIIDRLERVWDIPLSAGGKVLALTVPETRRPFPGIIANRNHVNDFIRGYKRENFFHFDLFTELPYQRLSRADQDKYWDPDGVHLTADGYDRMGELIAHALVKIIRLAEARDTDISSVVTDARQRKAIEDLIFEEERGDPKLLSQGYIVVRKKDLD